MDRCNLTPCGIRRISETRNVALSTPGRMCTGTPSILVDHNLRLRVSTTARRGEPTETIEKPPAKVRVPADKRSTEGVEEAIDDVLYVIGAECCNRRILRIGDDIHAGSASMKDWYWGGWVEKEGRTVELRIRPARNGVGVRMDRKSRE